MTDDTIRTILVTVATAAFLRNPETHSSCTVTGQPPGRNPNQPVPYPFELECRHDKSKTRSYSIRIRGDISKFAQECKDPDEIKLVEKTKLPTHGLSMDEFLSLIHAPVLEMCIRVEMSTITKLDFSNIVKLSGSCEGPWLVIAQNLNLEDIKFNDNFMQNSPENTVVIRGNPKLKKVVIEGLKKKFRRGSVDLQTFGECGPPSPFTSFAPLVGCKNVFGVISVKRNVDSVVRLPKNKGGLQFQGCLHIVNTNISNIDFLDDISTFIPSPYPTECPHVIADNANLCIRDVQRLKSKFKGILIYQDESCETVCPGGVVDDDYLATVQGCKTINGDLIIRHWNNVNSSLEGFSSIERINGSLIISDCSGIGRFDALRSLKEVTLPAGKRGPAIDIEGNPGLSSLDFPELSKVEASDNIKIRIVKNPSLTMKKALVENMYKMSKGKSHTEIEYTDASNSEDKFSEIMLGILILVLILLIILVALCIACIFFMPYYQERQATNKFGFPLPPWKVNKKSREILAGWVKDIAEKNPLIWRCSDRDVIWSYSVSAGAHKDIEVLIANNASFLKEHMLPLASNGRIGESDRFMLCERLKAFLEKDVIVVIGAAEHPSGVLPHLPELVKGEHTYKYLGTSYTCTLTKITKVAPNTKEYTYNVVTVEKKDKKQTTKNMHIFYYRWSNTTMPSEYDEILQLAMVYKPNKTICASDRRKEVFSLIHMFHVFCMELQEPIKLVDALQLHTEKCNGAVLDRSELGYVMAVLMEWAYQSRSVTPELKKKHMEWCHSYAIMDRFMRRHRNIKLIHPDYLPKLDSHIRHSVLVEGFVASPRFSERESAAIVDPFRRKNVEELPIYKRVSIEKKSSDSEEDPDGEPGGDLDEEFWLNQKKLGSREKIEENKQSKTAGKSKSRVSDRGKHGSRVSDRGRLRSRGSRESGRRRIPSRESEKGKKGSRESGRGRLPSRKSEKRKKGSRESGRRKPRLRESGRRKRGSRESDRGNHPLRESNRRRDCNEEKSALLAAKSGKNNSVKSYALF